MYLLSMSISKFSDLAEDAYKMKTAETGSHILASTLLEAVDNHHIKAKLRAYTGDILIHSLLML